METASLADLGPCPKEDAAPRELKEEKKKPPRKTVHCNCCFWWCLSVTVCILIALISFATHLYMPEVKSLILGNRSVHTPLASHRNKRAVPVGCLPPTAGPECNGLTLWYDYGHPTSFTFDLCSVIDCRGRNSSYRGYDLYMCNDPMVHFECTTKGTAGGSWCGEWGQVRASTHLDWSPVRIKPEYMQITYWDRFKFQRDFSPSQNPVTLSLDWQRNPDHRCRNWTYHLILGVHMSGADAMGIIKIKSKPRKNTLPTPSSQNGAQIDVKKPLIITTDYTQLTPVELLSLSTGYTDSNLWLNWLAKEARNHINGSCVACASARPHLFTEPAPLHPEDSWGFNCMLALTREVSPLNCTTLASIFPPIANDSKTGPFQPNRGPPNQYICFNFTGSNYAYGNIPQTWCNSSIPGDPSLIGPLPRAGLFWYCGNGLHTRILPDAKGACAMVRLAAPLTLLGNRLVGREQALPAVLTARRRRHVIKKRSTSFDLSLNSPTYIDAIGVPRGVPDEYKLADQVAAGFENIPIISAFFPVTPNKNVDRINYVHYNVQRLANLTRDAVEGLSEQLAATSLMAVQNRMALDMLLAEKGGVCAMFGDMCCTFIPNNTAPDGSVTKALEGLRTLSREMAENSGIENPLDGWFNRVFGKWKGIVIALLTSITSFLAILLTCGCCCVPCIRTLCVRFISATVEKGSSPPSGDAMMPLLTVEPSAPDYDSATHTVFS